MSIHRLRRLYLCNLCNLWTVLWTRFLKICATDYEGC